MNRQNLRRLVFVLGVIALGACTSNVPPPPEPSLVTSARVSSVTSSSASSTAAEPTTDRATTTSTVPASLSTTSEAAPVISTLPTDGAAADVDAEARATVDRFQEAWRSCLRSLPHCDTTSLDGTTSGSMLQTLSALADGKNAEGNESRNIDEFALTVENVDPRDTAALVGICGIDGTIAVLPTATGEQVVDDTFVSAKSLYTIRRGSDGVWRIDSALVIEKVTGREGNLCAS